MTVGLALAALLLVRAGREDLDVRPARWDCPLVFPAVRAALQDPLRLTELRSNLAVRLSSASTAGLLETAAADFFERPAPTIDFRTELLDLRALPQEAGAPVQSLWSALAFADAMAKKSRDSFSPSEREAALAELRQVIAHERAERQQLSRFKAMERFSIGPMLDGGRELASAIEKNIPALEAAAAKVRGKTVIKTRLGEVIVQGAGENRYSADELARAALVLNLGGSSSYKGSLAAAKEGRAAAVIDLSPSIAVEGEQSASAEFGISAVYFPKAGPKKLSSGDFSLGAALFGVSILSVNGPAALESGDFSQGAAGFGVAVVDTAGDASKLSATYAAQGAGFTQGVAVLRHQGGQAELRCGLKHPDARDPKALLSMCQGVGYGPRAFAGGGIGLASVAGNAAKVEASYFSQGSGYWFGLGGFFLSGDGNRLQARRYSQGAGVHTALGVLSVAGSNNRVNTWAVGPAYGWDFGIGYLDVEGDGNRLQADWGTGHGDVNGHALARVSGNGNTLVLPDFGSGALSRGAPSYALAAIEGSSNTVKDRSERPNAWGVVTGTVSLNPDLAAQTLEWPPKPEEDRAAQAELAARLLQAADALPKEQQLAQWLYLTASQQLGNAASREAAERLLVLPPTDWLLLLKSYAPQYFDEFAWARTFFSAYGEGMAKVIESTLPPGPLRYFPLGLFRFMPARAAWRALAPELKSSDRRARTTAASVLGSLLNREGGNDLGRLRALQALADGKKEPPPLREKRPADLFAYVGLYKDAAPGERLALFRKCPSPFDAVNEECVKDAWRLFDSDVYRRAFREEIAAADSLKSEVRAALSPLAKAEDRDERASALQALGQIGDAADAPAIAAALEDGSGLVREQAAVALAKMGAGGRDAIEAALRHAQPRVRMLAAIACARNWDEETFALIARALNDKEADVRSTALAALAEVHIDMVAARKKLRDKIKQLADGDPSPSVRRVAAQALALIGTAE